MTKVIFRDIELAVSKKFNMSPEKLRRPRCPGSECLGKARPRQILMYLARKHTRLSYPKIGLLVNRHHTCVLGAWRRIPFVMEKKPKLREYVEEIEAMALDIAAKRNRFERRMVEELYAGRVSWVEKAA